jgi:hypothetical protein
MNSKGKVDNSDILFDGSLGLPPLPLVDRGQCQPVPGPIWQSPDIFHPKCGLPSSRSTHLW